MTEHFLENSQINLIPELRVFLHNFSLHNKSLKHMQTTSGDRYYLSTARN